jgi:phage tail sheath gpL-like
MGVLLRTRTEAAPDADAAFIVADSSLTIQAVSGEAEIALGLREVDAINRHITELLIPADAEAAPLGLAEAITCAAAGDEEPMSVVVRPSGSFGIRLRVQVAACGPPAAALLVLN